MKQIFNIVELFTEPDGNAFDQACAHGHRVGVHAVYCHNKEWTDKPGKCKRTWYTNRDWFSEDEKIRDEDCPGFEPNPNKPGEKP